MRHAALVSGLLVAAVAAPVRADVGPPSRVAYARVKATSTKKDTAAWAAFDGDRNTAWCSAKKDVSREWLSLVLVAPVHVDEVRIVAPAGIAVEIHDGTRDVPPVVDVTAGPDGVARESVNGRLEELNLTFTKGREANPCITEVGLFSGGVLLDVRLLEPGADAALPAALAGLTRATATCDARALGKLATLPLARVYTDQGVESRTQSMKYRTGKELAAGCARDWTYAVKWIPKFQNQGCRTGGMNRVVCRAKPPVDSGFDAFHLEWRKGTWRLVSIVSEH